MATCLALMSCLCAVAQNDTRFCVFYSSSGCLRTWPSAACCGIPLTTLFLLSVGKLHRGSAVCPFFLGMRCRFKGCGGVLHYGPLGHFTDRHRLQVLRVGLEYSGWLQTLHMSARLIWVFFLNMLSEKCRRG